MVIKFVLKIWISGRVSYFVGILSGVGDIFSKVVLKFFFLLNIILKFWISSF